MLASSMSNIIFANLIQSEAIIKLHSFNDDVTYSKTITK